MARLRRRSGRRGPTSWPASRRSSSSTCSRRSCRRPASRSSGSRRRSGDREGRMIALANRHNPVVARVLLGVTGGIAAYKACELCRLLMKAGHEVTPVLTADSERFVTTHTFEALARRESPSELYPHLLDADLLVVAPLSANTLAKLAHGI